MEENGIDTQAPIEREVMVDEGQQPPMLDGIGGIAMCNIKRLGENATLRDAIEEMFAPDAGNGKELDMDGPAKGLVFMIEGVRMKGMTSGDGSIGTIIVGGKGSDIDGVVAQAKASGRYGNWSDNDTLIENTSAYLAWMCSTVYRCSRAACEDVVEVIKQYGPSTPDGVAELASLSPTHILHAAMQGCVVATLGELPDVTGFPPDKAAAIVGGYKMKRAMFIAHTVKKAVAMVLNDDKG